MPRQRARGVVGHDCLRRNPDAGLGFDMGPQLQVAQGIKAVLGERTIGVDRPAQDEAHLVGDQSA